VNPANDDPDAVVIHKEMTATREEFLRSLPRALGTEDYDREADTFAAAVGAGRMEVHITPLPEWRIGLLALPVLKVRLSFLGLDAAAVEDALARFDRAFQRGGG